MLPYTMLSSSFAIFSAFAAVFATPLAERQITVSQRMCSPNFEGTGISVTNSAREWATKERGEDGSIVFAPRMSSQCEPFDFPNFRFEQDGQPGNPSGYLIKPVERNDLAVTLKSDKTLFLAPIKQGEKTQRWNILCDECGTAASVHKGQFSVGCNITAVTSHECVQINRNVKRALFTAPCNGEDSQNFDFWTQFTFDFPQKTN